MVDAVRRAGRRAPLIGAISAAVGLACVAWAITASALPIVDRAWDEDTACLLGYGAPPQGYVAEQLTVVGAEFGWVPLGLSCRYAVPGGEFVAVDPPEHFTVVLASGALLVGAGVTGGLLGARHPRPVT